jgi:flavodoxin
MRVLIAYASWFGHNRTIAKMLARELERQRAVVICAPVSWLRVEEVLSLDLLVLGTYTHAGHANRRLLRLCGAIPRRRLEHMAVAVFGTQNAELLQAKQPGGVDELVGHLEARGFEIVTSPLRIGLRGAAAVLPWKGIGARERGQVQAFVQDLLEVSVPAPLG